MTKAVYIDPATRLEGHVRLNIQFSDVGIFEKVEFQSYEPPRGFERLFIGMVGEEVPRLAAKICGICYSAHCVAAVQAIENAWGVEPPEDAIKLRELMLLANLLQSHILHFTFLAMPDFLCDNPQEKNFVGLLNKDKELVEASVKLRAVGQKITEILGGRQIHPATIVPGGMTKSLNKDEVEKTTANINEAKVLVETLKNCAEKVMEAKASLLKKFGKINSHFLCLQQKQHLTLCNADLELSTRDGRIIIMKPEKYSKLVRERVVDYSFIKQPYLDETGLEDGLIRVGPLARVNRCEWNSKLLRKFDKAFPRPSQSTLAYNIARTIEIEECLKRIEEIINDGVGKHFRETVKPRDGHGVGIVEAPRGLLFHYYSTDRQGIVTEANLIAPTTQNALAIEKSAEAAARERFAGKAYESITRDDLDGIEMVVRAYDPCLSCSVHLVQIKGRFEDGKSNKCKSHGHKRS